jgi:integrase
MWEDVDFERGKLRIHQQLNRRCELVPTKGATSRRRDPRDVHPIDLMPPAQAALRELGPRDSGFIFRNTLDQPRHPRDIVRSIAKAVRYAKLPVTDDGRVTCHSLRHK